jgi:hypothetical protein
VDRLAAKTGAALLALTLVLGAIPASAETPPADAKAQKAAKGKDKKADATPPRRNPVQLEAVNITGTPEHPAILFFLPRAKFRLLPLREREEWKERLLAETKEMGESPR